jgi:hypothetical protein
MPAFFGSTHEVERYNGLWKEAVPNMDGEFRVGLAESSKKVVLEVANGLFVGACTMYD